MNSLYLCKRIGLMAVTVLSVTLLTFIMLRLTPGDPAELILQKVFVGTEEYAGSREEKARIADRYDLNRPMLVQYRDWLAGAVRLDLGTSYSTGQQVVHELGRRIRATLSLALPALVLSLGLTLLVAGVYNLSSRPLIRKMLDGIIIAAIAIPNFYLGILCILLFSVYLDLLPVSGVGGPSHHVLPVLTLALTMFGYTTTILNDSVADVRSRAFMLTALAKGLPPLVLFRNHILRNAMAPVIPYVTLQLGYLLGGVVVIETLFAWPGIGRYLVDAIGAKDLPVIQACIGIIALGYSMANLAGDMLLRLIDPRVRF